MGKRFDLLTVDKPSVGCLPLIGEAGTLTVVDLDKRALVSEVPIGRSADVAVDAADNEYLVSTKNGITVVDRSTLKKVADISTPGPADAIAFDEDRDRLFIGYDDSNEIWVVDPRQRKIVGRIAIPGAPELMQIDSKSQRLYVNIKTANEVSVIDLGTEKMVSNWPTQPTDSPHGLALDRKGGRLFVVGRSRYISVISLKTGKKIETIDVGPGRIDQIAFDPETDNLYCPDNGSLIVVADASQTPSVAQSLPIPKGTHSVVLDPGKKALWVAYPDAKSSYVQPFVLSQADQK